MDAITPPSVKERPIIFSAAMVRAILEGRKTQTRRIMKPQPSHDLRDGLTSEWCWPRTEKQLPARSVGFANSDTSILNQFNPYGQPGDRLWVRETWSQNQNQYSETFIDDSLVYRADGEFRAQDNGTDLPWRPSIHMPRWASRILLEIVSVRVERLQNIDDDGALAEGYAALDFVCCNSRKPAHWSAKEAFAHEWCEAHGYDAFLNGASSWEANPWVWVVEFKRVDAA